MGNYVIAAGNYVIVSPSELGNYKIVDMNLTTSSAGTRPRSFTSIPCALVLQRHFVTARSVTVDVMRPPPDDPKVCGQQKIVRWPLASA
jgi:hypothetical protein